MHQENSEKRKNSQTHCKNFKSQNENSYVNISAYRLKSKYSLKDKSYVNINAYIKTNDTKPANTTIQFSPNFDLFSNDNDSDYGCDEVGNPKINYHILDFRKNKLKKSNRYVTTSVNISHFNSIDHIDTTSEAWRRRSLTPDSVDYCPKLHKIIYADLIISDHIIDNQSKENLIIRKNHLNFEKIEYAEIDYAQTQALEAMDYELENIKSSKSWKNSYRVKLRSIVTIYHRLLKTFKSTKKKSDINEKSNL